jgi:DNA repair exonuclease SbcCD ATPase subunit
MVQYCSGGRRETPREFSMTSDSPQLKGALFGFRRASVRQLLAGRETMFRFAQERAQAAEAKAEEFQAELKAAQSELVVQTEAAESAHAATRAELQEATEALREQTERAAAVAAALSELEVELTDARHTAVQQADAMSELAGVRTELETARTELAARADEARSAEARIHELQTQLEAGQNDSAQRATEPGTAAMAEAEDLTLMLNAAERGVTGIMERARRAYEEQLSQAERVRETIQADVERFGDWQENVEPLIRSVQQGIETARGRIIRIPDQIREAVDSMTEAMMAVSDSLERLATLPVPLSKDPLADADESPGSAEDTVIRLKDSDPGKRITVVPPSNISQDEDEEADGATRRETEPEVEERQEQDHVTRWESHRNRGQ